MRKVFIVFLTSFLLGVTCTWFVAKNIQTGLGKTTENGFFIPNDKLDLKDFWTVYNIIEEEYFSNQEVKKEDIVRGAISGMVDALGDLRNFPPFKKNTRDMPGVLIAL